MNKAEELIACLEREITKLDARIEAQETQINILQSDANSWQSGYDEGRRMGAKHAAPVSEAKVQGVVMSAREVITNTIGFEFLPGELQTVNSDDLVAVVHAARLNAAPVQHPDDAAVDRFAVAMKAKLAASREKGRHGWQNATAPHLSSLLHEHMYKGDPLDVGNLAMMLHQNGQAIELPHDARRVTTPVQQVGVPEDADKSVRHALEAAHSAIVYRGKSTPFEYALKQLTIALRLTTPKDACDE